MGSFDIFRAFNEGGFVMFIILVILIVTVLLVFERFLTLRKLAVDHRKFTNQLFGMLMKGDLRQAIAYCDSRSTPLTNTVKAGLVCAMNKRPDEEIQVAMDASVLQETPRLEGWTSFLAVTGNLAMLSGLLGTIVGMISSFRAVAVADPAEKARRLSEGISHALNCTAFGLFVAIISVVCYGYFQMRVQRSENEVVEVSMSVLNLVAANRDKFQD